MPAVKTGSATTLPAPVVNEEFLVDLDFTPNAAASRNFPTGSYAKAWLTPGFVGLYQVNVPLPSTFPDVPSCVPGVVQSNLTISLGADFSTDGAAICAPLCGNQASA
jgi:hypothetical protein